MKDNAYLRPRDVAHILDCCPDDLYPLIYSGEIKAYKEGRMWRFRLEDVMDYKQKAEGNNTGKPTHGGLNSTKPGKHDN